MSELLSTPTAQPPGAWRRLMRNRVAVAALLILAAITFVAIFGPPLLRERYDPETPTAAKLVTPCAAHYFGTDMNGRDVFSRVIQGGRISLIVGLCGALVSFFIGTTYGLIAGYAGGRTDNVMMRFVEMLHSVPRLIIVIVAIFSFGPWLENRLNHSTVFGLFGNNPRIVFTIVCLLLWLIWRGAEKSRDYVRARLLWILALLLSLGISLPLIKTGGAAGTVALCYATFLISTPILALFLRIIGISGASRTWLGILAVVTTGLFLSPSVERIFASYRLNPLVGYSKVIILILCLGLIEWLAMARIVRGQVLALKEQQFVLAARALGQSHARILLRHLLPNLIGVIVVYLTLTIPAVILDESFLSFLGLGINDPQASWGSLLSDGKNVINPIHSYWWLLLFPAAAMSLTLVALNFLGDAIRDALDPRARR